MELQSVLADELDVGHQCTVYSMDLSAAFDLIRPGTFVRKALKIIPESRLVSLMYDFITELHAYVKINGVAN
jgi:hypothetical protein